MSPRGLMNLLPVSARRLCHRRLRGQGSLTRDACLFPFFDRAGGVAQVMLLTADSDRICLVRWRPRLFRVPAWGPICLREALPAFPEITAENLKSVETLWHYDPWWMLDNDRYAGHRAVPILKATNCADQLRRGHRIVMAYFRRDLARLTWVAARDRGSVRLRSWQGEFLPAGPRKETTPVSAMAADAQPLGMARTRAHGSAPVWRLAPIWSRWTAR